LKATRRMRGPLNIAWFAGLIEGEGCFTRCRRSIQMTVVSTDKDVIEQAALMTGKNFHVTHRKGPGGERWKPIYRTHCCGATAASWMMTLYPFLKSRRRARVRELLVLWKLDSTHARDRVKCLYGHEYDVAPAALQRHGSKRFCPTCLKVREKKRNPRRRTRPPC